MRQIWEFKTLDGTRYYLTSTGKVNGPSQGEGGLQFGTSYLYISKDKDIWVKAQARSNLTMRNLILESNSTDIDAIYFTENV